MRVAVTLNELVCVPSSGVVIIVVFFYLVFASNLLFQEPYYMTNITIVN